MKHNFGRLFSFMPCRSPNFNFRKLLIHAVYAESFINYNYEEINKICDPYWVAAYPDVVSSSDEDEEATLADGASPAGRPRQASGSGATSGAGGGAAA